MNILETPLDEEEIRNYRVGDIFKISGKVFTARDAAHKKLLEVVEKDKKLQFPFEDYPCFHCGPVMEKKNEEWNVISAGPTTSIRMEIFEEEFMKKIGTKVFIGKGGMGEDTSKALENYGGVYAQYTGGAGSLMAKSVKEIEDVYYLEELGIPEAVWIFKVEEFGPLVVTMDSEGSSIHRNISKKIENNLEKVKKEL